MMGYTCNNCFAEFETPKKKRTLTGRHYGHPDEDSEDEYDDVCPECDDTDIDVQNLDRRIEMKQQLKVFDPNTGDWFEVGTLDYRKNGRRYITRQGNEVWTQRQDARNIHSNALTPIEPPLAMTLGLAMIESVPEGERNNITNFRPPMNGDDFVGANGGRVTATFSYSTTAPKLILSPPPPPEPEPKTVDEHLDAVIAAYEKSKRAVENDNLYEAVDAARNRDKPK